MAKNFGNVVIDTTIMDKVLAEEPQKVGRWLSRLAESIVTDVKLSMNTSPPGESYTRGNVTHVASQPGYPPNVDIGTLRASIKWENTGPHERTISDGVEYGVWLEDGTESMAPRPFMGPAFERARQTYEQDAKDYLGLEDV